MKKVMSLKAKMVLFALSIASFLLIQGGALIYLIHNITKFYDHVATINLPNSDALGKMQFSTSKISVFMNRLGLVNGKTEEIEKIRTIVNKVISDYREGEKIYLSVDFVDGEQALYDAINASFTKILESSETLFKLAYTKTPEDEAKYLSFLLNDYKLKAEDFENKIGNLIAFQSTESKKWSQWAKDEAAFSNKVAIFLLIGGFATALVITFVFSNKLSNTINELAKRLGQGANEVASASKQVSDSSSELSASTTEQAAALQQTVASIDEVSAMVSKNAENAKKSQEVSSISHQAAVRGQHVVEEMIEAIAEINQSNAEIMQQIENSNREISDIVKVISEIGNKTKVINDIVFQTKLLSFNASVEAARAGEHGKGFAVVAEEVGNLAQMSGNAAKEISEMLDGSIHKVEKIVHDTKSKVEHLVVSGKQKVEAGTMTANRCGEVLTEIVTRGAEVGTMVGEIAIACQEQAQGVQEITKAIGQLDQVTGQNAAASQQSAGASEQLTAQAGELRSIVNILMQTVSGGYIENVVKNENFQQASKTSRSEIEGNVLAFKTENLRKAKGKSTSNHTEVAYARPAKKVVGGDVFPEENDPRFKDF